MENNNHENQGKQIPKTRRTVQTSVRERQSRDNRIEVDRFTVDPVNETSDYLEKKQKDTSRKRQEQRSKAAPANRPIRQPERNAESQAGMPVRNTAFASSQNMQKPVKPRRQSVTEQGSTSEQNGQPVQKRTVTKRAIPKREVVVDTFEATTIMQEPEENQKTNVRNKSRSDRNQDLPLQQQNVGLKEEMEPAETKQGIGKPKIEKFKDFMNRPIGKTTTKDSDENYTSAKYAVKEKTDLAGDRIAAKDKKKNVTGNNVFSDPKRELRRKRRIRNQTISYAMLVVVVGCLVFGVLWGVKQVLNGFQDNSYNINNGIAQNEIETMETDETVSETIQESVAEETQQPVRDELDDVVDAYLADMTIEEMISQMFVITPEELAGIKGPATKAGSKTEAGLKEKIVGGILFQSKNFAEKEGTKSMVTGTASLAQRPIFTTVMEEGGTFGTLNQIKALEVPKTLTFPEIGETKDVNKAYEAGKKIGTYLKEYGFNLNLAPVADLCESGSQSGLSERVFGNDPQMVSEMVAAYVRGMEETGVHACLSHFPGQGSTTGDSTKGIAYSENSLNDFMERDFLPFQSGIDAGAQFVMVGHVAASNITGDTTPASLSDKVITDLLRNQLGFQGVVITDRLDYPSITDYYTPELSALMAVNAGADILLCPEDYTISYNALLQAVQDGTISEDRIRESVHRIYRIKLSNAG